ncbi:MAG: hypothetical protein WC277_05000 [Bacilli bacterium]
MPLNEIATQSCFRGLTCPYTGRKVTVRVVAGAGQPMFFSPDAFDPSMPVESAAELMRLVGMREGVMGALPPGGESACPYTGRQMTLRSGRAGFWFDGGFSPGRPVEGAARFAALMRTRGGVGPEAVAPARVSFGRADDDGLSEARPAKKEPSAAAYAQAEAAAAAAVRRRPAVTVPKAVPKRKGKK